MATRETVRTRDPDAQERRIREGLAEIEADRRERIRYERSQQRAAQNLPDRSPARVRHRNWQRIAASRLADARWEGRTPAEEPIPFRDEQLEELGPQYLEAARRGDFAKFMVFLEEGFPVNYRDLRTGETALHIAAGTEARRIIAALLASGQCDFLARDRWGRLGSEVAYLCGENPALAILLGKKEQAQGLAQGVEVTRRPSQPAAS